MKNLYHLSAIISLVRHGEKDSQGNLTEKGLQQAIKRGVSLRNLVGGVHVYHSGVDRVRKTALAVAQYLPESLEGFIHKQLDKQALVDEGVSVPEEQIDELHYVFDPKAKSDYFKSWAAKASTADRVARMDAFLNHRSTSPEPEVVPAPRQMAQRVLMTLLKQIDQSLSSSYQVKENFINVSHEPVIMATLFYLLQDFKPKINDFTHQVGGSVRFAEGFDINVYQTESNKVKLLLEFREFLVELTLADLQAFVAAK